MVTCVVLHVVINKFTIKLQRIKIAVGDIFNKSIKFFVMIYF